MTSPIEFWFDFASPYAYFATIEVEDRLARFGRPLLWRPFLLGVAFQKTGMGALTHMPMRGDYARRDWTRIATKLGVPYVLRDDHPFPSQALARSFYWLLDRQPERAVPFAKAAFKTYFGLGHDLRETADVLALAADFTDSSDTLADWLKTDEAKQLLRARTDEALGKGVFGSPFFLADGEPFWGWDRISMLEDWLGDKQSAKAP